MKKARPLLALLALLVPTSKRHLSRLYWLFFSSCRANAVQIRRNSKRRVLRLTPSCESDEAFKMKPEPEPRISLMHSGCGYARGRHTAVEQPNFSLREGDFDLSRPELIEDRLIDFRLRGPIICRSHPRLYANIDR